MTATAPLLEEFEALRPRLFGIAYRMLGSRSDAEDVVQEAWIRLSNASDVAQPEGYLVTIVTRLCIDHLRSGWTRRAEYIGPWLPEPLPTEGHDPGRDVERLEMLSLAVLRVVERLEPLERAVFLLREVFGYGYEEVSAMVDRRPDHCRQIAHRARQRVRATRPRREADPREHRLLLERFLQAAHGGDVEALETMLVEDAVALSDSGGKVSSARRPVRGRNAVARFVTGIMKKAPADVRMENAELNGLPAVLAHTGEGLVLALTIDVRDGRIAEVLSVRNPEKLARLGRDLTAAGRDSGEAFSSPEPR
jgi:RNA polymerase sigma-70 factor (ECF subfamily)